MRIFGQLLLVDKQKIPYLYRTTSKEFEFLHKSYVTAVAMADILVNDIGDPQILFKKILSLSIINKKILKKFKKNSVEPKPFKLRKGDYSQ